MNCYISICLSIEREKEKEEEDWFDFSVSNYSLYSIQVSPIPLTRTQRATAATKYSMYILPFLPLTLKKVYEVKQANKMNISRTCNTEQQEAQQNPL